MTTLPIPLVATAAWPALRPAQAVKAALFAAAALVCSPGWAGRPLVTEDAGVLARGECEWESFAGKQVRPQVLLGATQVGCGVGRDSQLSLGISRELSKSDGSSYLTLNGKTAFGQADESAPAFAIAYAVLGGREQTDYMNYVTAEIKAVLTIPTHGWLLHANAGLLHIHQDSANRATWALALERPGALAGVDLMGEIYGDDKNSPWVQTGMRWNAIPGRLCIDASLGVQTNGAHTRLATLGMKLAF